MLMAPKQMKYEMLSDCDTMFDVHVKTNYEQAAFSRAT
jgi:hypothetical protein